MIFEKAENKHFVKHVSEQKSCAHDSNMKSRTDKIISH